MGSIQRRVQRTSNATCLLVAAATPRPPFPPSTIETPSAGLLTSALVGESCAKYGLNYPYPLENKGQSWVSFVFGPFFWPTLCFQQHIWLRFEKNNLLNLVLCPWSVVFCPVKNVLGVFPQALGASIPCLELLPSAFCNLQSGIFHPQPPAPNPDPRPPAPNPCSSSELAYNLAYHIRSTRSSPNCSAAAPSAPDGLRPILEKPPAPAGWTPCGTTKARGAEAGRDAFRPVHEAGSDGRQSQTSPTLRKARLLRKRSSPHSRLDRIGPFPGVASRLWGLVGPELVNHFCC